MNSPYNRPSDSVEVNSTPVEEDTTVRLETINVEPETRSSENVRVEEFSITGEALVTKVKELIHQGNIRRITIKTDEGRALIEIPLTVGVVGGVVATSLFPIIAAIGAIGALVAHLKIAIERTE
ncbi:DUF4342 domain-containing protein [Microcoleus sp. FACHB-68]|uniref:DUF4342 domain-containing protein n=1 Tax=Microcoleus sp. FACHB-68 TaxID=2692826 RepID=UPI001689DE36|nr:DUF4342 domain-containing protein [Microcoleus sp. FACHB-68]MBD1938651.1 DUF4342 domain-containing protein [Microcoleus sp. FACHB-68]